MLSFWPRKLHTQLNRLIIQRLPLALPPCAPHPSLYCAGIGAFAPIYRTFESTWLALLQAREHSHAVSEYLGSDRGGGGSPKNPDVIDGVPTLDPRAYSPRIHDMLDRIYLPSLMRTQSFDADVAYLLGHSSHHQSRSPHQATPYLESFIAHIQASLTAKPHVLIAYTWIFYMALFSGGRWIRAQLQAAGDDFWCWSDHPVPNGQSDMNRDNVQETPQLAERRGFSFLCFPGLEDGEDIKREFRARLAEIEPRLTDDERAEIVTESIRIFEHCISLVEELHSSLSAKSTVAPLGTWYRAMSLDNILGFGFNSGDDRKPGAFTSSHPLRPVPSSITSLPALIPSISLCLSLCLPLFLLSFIMHLYLPL